MKKHIKEFLKARVLPDKLSDEFVQAIREALSDLKKVTIKVPDLKEALLAGGSLFNPHEMQTRLGCVSHPTYRGEGSQQGEDCTGVKPRMSADQHEWKKLLAEGETLSVEFKSDLKSLPDRDLGSSRSGHGQHGRRSDFAGGRR